MRALSLVEKGWAGARQVSVQLAKQGVVVHHLVKGRVASEVLACLTPYPGLVVQAIPRRWYRLVVWGALLRARMRRGPQLILVDNERAANWVARVFPRLHERVIVVREEADGSPLMSRQGAAVELQHLLQDGRA